VHTMEYPAGDEWIGFAEALQITINKTGLPQWRQILKRARDGIIEAKASHYIAPDRRTGAELRHSNHVLPREFFWAGDGSALEWDSTAGDFSTWINQKWHCRAYGVKFRRSDIVAMLPAADDQSTNSHLPSEQLHPVDTSPDATIAPTTPRLHKPQLEHLYRERVNNWPPDKKSPSPDEDWDFLRQHWPGISRDRMRDIRRELAPPEWREPGPKRSREESRD
jgi:hypothetical protein